MTFDPVTTKVYWTHWTSVRHTDGRRASGVGYNHSRWHAFTVFGEENLSKVNYRAICGLEIQIQTGEWREIPPLEQVCSKCFEMVK